MSNKNILEEKKFSVNEVAAMTGMKPQSIRRMIATGRLTAYRVAAARRIVIPESQVKRLLEPVKPSPTPSERARMRRLARD